MAGKCLTFRVSGRVQGVWFRAWTREAAQARGLDGWVRNEADGTVSGVVAGPEAEVAAFVAALHDGPDLARVDRVETGPVDELPPRGFRIAR